MCPPRHGLRSLPSHEARRRCEPAHRAGRHRGEISVLGGDQTRPNIHIRDLVRVFEHFIALGEGPRGVFNAGFENLTILQIAETVARHVPAKIAVAPSNDPRSYRLCSRKLESTGFVPRYCVEDAIREISEAFTNGTLKDEDRWYNVRSMKKIPRLCGAAGA